MGVVLVYGDLSLIVKFIIITIWMLIANGTDIILVRQSIISEEYCRHYESLQEDYLLLTWEENSYFTRTLFIGSGTVCLRPSYLPIVEFVYK